MAEQTKDTEILGMFRNWTLQLRLQRAVLGLSVGLFAAYVLLSVAFVGQLWFGVMWSPVPTGTVVVVTATLVAILRWFSRIQPARILHQIDRVHGHPDTLLCAYELLRSDRAYEPDPVARRIILADAVRSARDVQLTRAFPLPLPRVILFPLVGLAGFWSVGFLPHPTGTMEALHAAETILTQDDLQVPESAADLSVGDREAMHELKKLVQEGRRGGSDRDQWEEEQLQEMADLLAALEEGEIRPQDAVARLMELQAKLTGASPRSEEGQSTPPGSRRPGSKGKDGEQADWERIEKKLAAVARKMLEEAGIKTSPDEQPGALLKALAKLAAKLAETNPDLAEALARKLARQLVDKDLRSLLNQRDRLSDKIKKWSTKLDGRGLNSREKRRLNRLKERLERKLARNEKKIAKSNARQDQGLERLRRNLERDQKPPGSSPSGPKKGNSESKKSGSSRSDSARRTQGPGGRGKGEESPDERIRDVGKKMERQSWNRKLSEQARRLSRGLRRGMRARAAARQLKAARAGRRRAGSGPERLTRKGSRGRTASRRSGAGPGKPGSGRNGAGEGAGPTGRGQKERSAAGFRDVRVESRGKRGGFEVHEVRGGDGSKHRGRAGRLGFDPSEVEDAAWEARIPERYRDTVRSYFELMSQEEVVRPAPSLSPGSD